MTVILTIVLTGASVEVIVSITVLMLVAIILILVIREIPGVP